MLPRLEHQEEGVRFLEEFERSALFDEPGLGKSRQLLESAVEPVLAIAPAMVIDGGVWDDEIEKWVSGMDVTQVAYSGLSGRERTQKGGTRPTGRLKDELRRPWGSVLCDEAHYLKGRKTNWTLCVKELSDLTDKLKLATGTPIPNWAHEAFVLLQLMFPDEAKPGRKYGSYWRWVKEWFDVGPLYNRKGEILTHHDIGAFREDREWPEFHEENWRDRMLLRLREECLDLPPFTEQTITVGMNPEQRKVYRALRKDFVTWLDSGVEIAAWSQAGLMVKLAQCATGLECLEPTAKSSGKLDALQTLLVDRELPTLVVAHFRSSVHACAKRAEEAGKRPVVVTGGTSRPQRKIAVREFQRGEAPVLCATIDTIAEGLTLNESDQAIRVERSYRPSRNEQVARRIHRIGQDKPVTVIDIVTRGTNDERVLELLASKTDQQMKALRVNDLRRLV